MNLRAPLIVSLMFGLVSLSHAADAAVDADLPQPLDPNLAQGLLDSPPFTRTLNLSDTLQLTGLAYVEGRPVATFFNRATKESFVVSEEPNAQGWKLAAAVPSTELRHAQVKVMIGSEVVTVRYGEAQLEPGATKKGSKGERSLPGAASSGDPATMITHYKTSSYLGENGKALYASLSSQSREQFKDTLRSQFERHPDYTDDQRAAYAQKVFAKIQTSDQAALAAGGNGAAAAPRSPKPSKSSRIR